MRQLEELKIKYIEQEARISELLEKYSELEKKTPNLANLSLTMKNASVLINTVSLADPARRRTPTRGRLFLSLTRPRRNPN